MPIPTAETLDSVEMAWLFANVVGLIVAVVGLVITNKNLGAARRAVDVAQKHGSLNQLHVSLAHEGARTEVILTSVLSIKVVVFLLFTGAGYLAALTAPPVVPAVVEGAQVRAVTLSFFIICAFSLMVTSMLLTADSVLRQRTRHSIINRIAAGVLRDQLKERGLIGEHAP
jgi:hypothetical protein